MTSLQVAFGETPTTVSDILKIRRVECLPLESWGQYSNGSDIVFNLPTNPHEFISTDIDLSVTFAIEKPDQTPIGVTDTVAIVNNMVHSWYEDLLLILGNTCVQGKAGNAQYLSYLKTLLKYGKTAQSTHLGGCSGWFRDTTTKFNDMGGANKGFEDRQILTANGGKLNLEAPLSLDLASAGLALPPGLRTQIIFKHASDRFVLMTPPLQAPAVSLEYKLKIVHIKLLVNYLTLSSEKLASIRAMHIQSPLTYSFYRLTYMSRFTFDVHITQQSFNLSAAGQLPDVIYIFFTYQNSANSYHKNPFEITSASVAHMQLEANGVYFPEPAVDINTDTGVGILPVYRELLSSIGILNTTGDIDMKLDDFTKSFFIYPIKLTTHYPTANMRNPYNSGSARIKIRLATAPTDITGPLQVWAVGLYSGDVKIHSDLNTITTSFS